MSNCLQRVRGMKLRGKGGTQKPQQKCGFPPFPLAFLPPTILFSFTPLPLFRTFNCLQASAFAGFILLPFLGDDSFAQNVERGSSIILIIILQFLEEIPSAWFYLCPFCIAATKSVGEADSSTRRRCASLITSVSSLDEMLASQAKRHHLYSASLIGLKWLSGIV